MISLLSTTTSQTIPHARITYHLQPPTSLHIKPKNTATSPSTPVSGCAPAPPAAAAAPVAVAVELSDVTSPASVLVVLDVREALERMLLDSSSSSAAALDMAVVVGEAAAEAEGVAMDAVLR
jgi:hypothetical protein